MAEPATEIEQLPDGVYFDLPDEIYHGQNRLGSTDLKRLDISAGDFWVGSWLNPNPPQLTPDQEKRKSLARYLGRAYHCARLEPDAFPQRFAREPSKADYADAAGFRSTATEYGDALAALGQTKKAKGEGVTEQAHRLAQAMNDWTGDWPKGFTPGPVWHCIEALAKEWRGDRVPIAGQFWDEILTDMERLQQVPAVQALLSGGFAEVSVLFTCPDTGLKMKARLDYLAATHWVDFKTYTNTNGKRVEQVLLDAFRFNGYYQQSVAYRDAVEAIRQGQVQVQGEATDEQRALVAQLAMSTSEPPCHYIWQEKGGVPNVWVRRIHFHYVDPTVAVNHAGADQEAIDRVEEGQRQETGLFKRARADVMRAKQTFLNYSRVYPEGQPWLPYDPTGEWGDEDFPPYWLDERN